MKVNISFNDELLRRIDESADQNYMSRSGLVSYACTQYLNSQDVISAIKHLDLAVQKIASTGKVDKDTQRELDDFNRLAKLLIGS